MSKLGAFKYFLIAALLTGCANTYCRTPRKAYPSPKPTQPVSNSVKSQTVWVYKYDKSKQCQPGTGVSLEKMQSELQDIKVVSQQKRRDGLMHIQACGATTGTANVYKILAKDLKSAEKLGFKEWKFDE